jgi:hypothetical protein
MRTKFWLSCVGGTKVPEPGSNLTMLDSGNRRTTIANISLAMRVLTLIIAVPVAIGAQQIPSGGKPETGGDAGASASNGALLKLLPDTLAGHKSTGVPKLIARDQLGDLVGDKATVYQEYRVISAVSREYAGVRVDVFETRNQFAALGLFQFNNGSSKVGNSGAEIGADSARIDGGFLFRKGNLFVRVADRNPKPARGTSTVHQALARAVADAIGPASPAVTSPPLLDSLPADSLVPRSQRYFLGPESLNAVVERGREMFEFVGDTEAVVGEYARIDAQGAGNAQGHASGQTSGQTGAGAVARPALNSIAAPVKLVIVECHTPEFATDELARVTSYISSLPDAERQRIIFKRTGNYIVVAVNIDDHEFAEGLINSVQYPYTVKWLRNPLWAVNDPFRMEKTADMLLSTFGLLGLILLTVLVGGTIFGTSVFLRRRRQQREVFSDAGGMLRLDIEPFVLALPPKREE